MHLSWPSKGAAARRRKHDGARLARPAGPRVRPGRLNLTPQQRAQFRALQRRIDLELAGRPLP